MSESDGNEYRQRLIKNAQRRSVQKFNQGQRRQGAKVKALAEGLEQGVSSIAGKVKKLFK